MNVGWIWPPKYRPDRPVSLEFLHQALRAEHEAFRQFFTARDERLLGHIVLADPVIGALNMVQWLPCRPITTPITSSGCAFGWTIRTTPATRQRHKLPIPNLQARSTASAPGTRNEPQAVPDLGSRRRRDAAGPGWDASCPTALAVARAAEAGIRPVLCTGRRYRRARPIAEQLGLRRPIVCNSGAILKDPENHQTLWRADLDRSLIVSVLELFEAHGHPAVAFTDRQTHQADFIVRQLPSGQALFDDYVLQNRQHAEVAPEWTKGAADEPNMPPPDARFHLCAIGSRPEMLAVEAAVRDRLGGNVQTFVQRSPRYLGTMCEVLRHDASKWTAILHLAGLWNVDPSEICRGG